MHPETNNFPSVFEVFVLTPYKSKGFGAKPIPFQISFLQEKAPIQKKSEILWFKAWPHKWIKSGHNLGQI